MTEQTMTEHPQAAQTGAHPAANAQTIAQESGQQRTHPMLVIVGAGCISFGITLWLMGLLYMEDLALLQRVPEAVWLFVCGVPTTNELVLPLLVGFGSIGLLGGVGMIAAHRLRR